VWGHGPPKELVIDAPELLEQVEGLRHIGAEQDPAADP